MPQWIGTVNGRATLGIGLTIDDVIKLLKGDLIFISSDKLGLPVDVAVHYGKDEKELMGHLRDAGIAINNKERDDT